MPEEMVDKNVSDTGDKGTTEETKVDASKTKKGLNFDEEQVLWVNKHSDAMFAKGRDAAKGEYEGKLTEATTTIQNLTKQLEDLKAKVPAGADKDDEKDKDSKAKSKKSDEPSDDVKRLMATVNELQSNMTQLLEQNKKATTELETERARNREARIKDEFMSAAATLNFFDANDVFKLVQSDIVFDEQHGVIVKNHETGGPRMTVGGGEYRPVKLAEFLAEFATSKPQYVKASSSDGGSGAGGSNKLSTKETTNLPDFTKMTPAEIADYANQVKTRR